MKKLILTAFLFSTAASAAPASVSTFKGDGFDAAIYQNDGCRSVDIYLAGSDYSTRYGAGQPQTSNNLWGYAYVFDCDTQAWGWAYIDQSNATVDARGTNNNSTLSGAVEIESGHWEQDEYETCWTYEGWCWIDWDGTEVCEPGGEYCYYSWHWVADPSQTLSFDLELAPEGDTYRGLSMSSQRGPNYMYRYRYTGSQRYGDVRGTVALDGEELLGSSYSWASVWTTSQGTVSTYRF